MPNIWSRPEPHNHPSVPAERCLSQLRAGECGRVLSVQGDPHLTIRILELGLVSGTPLRVLRTAPLGGPIQLEIEGSLLSLRRNEADAIRVA